MNTAEKIFEKTQTLPESTQLSVLHFVETLAGNAPLKKPSSMLRKSGVQLPLIDSKQPGTLNLTNADIEELLA